NDDASAGSHGASQTSFMAAAASTYYIMAGVANPGAAASSPDLESGGKTALNLTGPAPVGLTASPSNATIAPGASTSYTINALSPPFAGQVALTVAGCPANATCTFQANTVTAGTGTTLSVATTAGSQIVVRRLAPQRDSRRWMLSPVGLLLV